MKVSANILSSLYMILSMLGYVLNDILIKSLDGNLPTPQILWVRGYFLSSIIFLIIWRRGLLPRWREAFTAKVGMRAGCEGAATLCFLTALVQLPFANLQSILLALPLVVTVGAAWIFKEPVGWRRWMAILIGFLGVLIIIRPGMDGFHFASVLVLISVLFAAARDLITRQIPSKLPSLMVSGMTALFVTLLGLSITVISGDSQPLSVSQFVTLACASIFLFFGYQFIVLSMRMGEIAYVVPYRYTSLLWAILFAYLVFNEVPDRYTLIGAAIVIATGLYTMYRELLHTRATQ